MSPTLPDLASRSDYFSLGPSSRHLLAVFVAMGGRELKLSLSALERLTGQGKATLKRAQNELVTKGFLYKRSGKGRKNANTYSISAISQIGPAITPIGEPIPPLAKRKAPEEMTEAEIQAEVNRGRMKLVISPRGKMGFDWRDST